MCWFGVTKKEKVRHKAIKDIEVFKIMNTSENNPSVLISPFQKCYYVIGKTESVKFNENIQRIYPFNNDDNVSEALAINEGLHSYNSNKVELKIIQSTYAFHISLCIAPFIKKGKEYHDLSLLPINYLRGKYVKANCIIPKGSYYYENNDGEIVSESLKIVSYEEIEGYEEKYQEYIQSAKIANTRTES